VAVAGLDEVQEVIIMLNKRLVIIGCWFLLNFVAVGLLTFSDLLVLRIIGWFWISLAISVSGLVVIGAMTGDFWSDDDHPSESAFWTHRQKSQTK
jgi:hypothetical protein